jgi:signal transduction histidine kinase
MGTRSSRPRQFVIGVTLRAVIVALLVTLIVYLVSRTQLYATALVVGLGCVGVIADLARLTLRASLWIEQDLERLVAEVSDAPAASFVPQDASLAPRERAAAALNAARVARQRQLEYLQTLLDTVSASLIILQPDGRVTLVNRAARGLAGAAVHRLEQIEAVGAQGALSLLALRPGTRQVVPLAGGRQMFVVVSEFAAPGQSPQRLVALQRIAGDLDAVELKAWQDMVQVLAHEMMNSLTPISSLSESLESLLRQESIRGAATTNEVAGALEAIRRRSLGLMDFVERYRSVAELPAPKRQPLRMDQLLSGIDRLLSSTLRERGIEYRTVVSPPDLGVDADPQLLEQAMINLLRNAADAVTAVKRDEGGAPPRIEVSCERRDNQVILSVADNGAGVPEDRRDQIFVPFFTTKAGGSGIGLNLARHVALGHGGQLDVRANRPRGSVFTLTIPDESRERARC